MFSFFYTEKIALLMQSKNELLKYINNVKDDYQVSSINAIIDGETIVPGINGLEVNSTESFLKMKELQTFNELYIVFEQIAPKISLEDNKDKIIIQGNKNKKRIAFLIKNNSSVESYLRSMNLYFESKNICVITSENTCNESKYRVKPTLTINHQNILKEKNKIESGFIILLEENVSVNETKILLNEVKYRDLKITSLESLISETNNVY